jgi:hypothetical protein
MPAVRSRSAVRGADVAVAVGHGAGACREAAGSPERADGRRLLLDLERPTTGRLARPDARIGDWFRPWTLKGDRSVGDAPPAALWASDERGFGQVGCVYTAQGSEYEWNGVLLGPDLVWRTDRWVAVRSANRDPDFRNTKRVSDAEFDLLVRNVYKVLLTRGLRGVYLHSTDPETQRFLEGLVG